MPVAPLPPSPVDVAAAAPARGASELGVGRRWATAGWALSMVVLLVVMTVLGLRVRDGSTGAGLQGAIVAGDRPQAPALPTAGIAGDGAPGSVPAGRVLVVNFWASWCGPCRDEAPMLDAFARDWQGRGVTVVGVNAGAEDTLRDARAFVREFEIGYPVLRATAGDLDRWGVHDYPETFVVGRDGRISARVAGPVDEQSLAELVSGELQRAREQAGDA